MAKLPGARGPNLTLNRREFVTGSAALLASGAVLAGCDEAAELDGCAAEPGPGEPPCPAVEPEVELDRRALRAFE